MKCEWVQERLLLYLAEELEPKESARVVTHMERCDACTSVLEELAESRDTLREAVRTTALPSESLGARIMQSVQASPRRLISWPVQLPVWRTREALAFAACALILVLSGYQWGRSTAGRAPLGGISEASTMPPMLDLASLAQTHRSWDSRSVAGVVDTKVVAERLSRQTGMTVTPLDIKESNFRLKEGDVLQMNHVPVATMHYDWKGTSVTLAQADGMRLAPLTSLREMRDHGRCFLVQHSGDLTFVLWCEGTETFVLVARVPPSQLFALACEVCGKMQRG